MKTVSWAVALHRKSGVIVDTNILLLYFVGIFDKARISTFKRASRESPKQIWKEGIKKGIYPNFFW